LLSADELARDTQAHRCLATLEVEAPDQGASRGAWETAL